MFGSDLAAILQTGLNRALALDPAGRAALMQSLRNRSAFGLQHRWRRW